MDDIQPNLVYIDEYDLLGENYYWRRSDFFGLTKEELTAADLPNERVRVSKDIIDSLTAVDNEFQARGYKLYVSEGYRPKDLYKLIYEKRSKKFGKESTDQLINMQDMPHATGRSVDVTLYKGGEPLTLRNRADGQDALFLDFYKDKPDQDSQNYQDLQAFVIAAMQRQGFRMGILKEYFHFNYSPESAPNYPLN